MREADQPAVLSCRRDRATTHLVERRKPSAVPPDAPSLAQSLLERLAQRQRTVLGRVVVVHLQVSLALELKRHLAMLGEGVQHLRGGRRGSGTEVKETGSAAISLAEAEGATHVVQETNARVHLDNLLRARLDIESQGALDVGLAGLAGDGRRANAVRVVLRCHSGRSGQSGALKLGVGRREGGDERVPRLVSCVSSRLAWSG